MRNRESHHYDDAWPGRGGPRRGRPDWGGPGGSGGPGGPGGPGAARRGPFGPGRWEAGPPGGPGGPGGPGWRGRGGWPGRGGRGGWGDPGGRGGPGDWGGRGDRMERGVLRYLLLDALRAGPKHGYEVIKWLEERTHGLYVPSPGTVYPTLQLLADQGFVAADPQDERRVYRLTESGQQELDAHAEAVQAVWARFPDEASAAGRHELGFLRDEVQDLMRTLWSGFRASPGSADAEQVRRVRQALERCKNEIREII